MKCVGKSQANTSLNLTIEALHNLGRRLGRIRVGVAPKAAYTALVFTNFLMA
jgi:hypothetical protein